MTVSVYKQGQLIKVSVEIKDFDGNYTDPDATPTCKIYFGTTVKSTLSVTKEDTGKYYAYYSIPSDADIGSYVVVWTWKMNTEDDLASVAYRVKSYLEDDD